MPTLIPVPPYIPLLGHAWSFDRRLPALTLREWSAAHGEIYEIFLISGPCIVVSSVELCTEISNDAKFCKSLAGALGQVRALTGDALFTAYHDEPNWGIAHRLLLPSFRMATIKETFPDMLDIASQMILKWERFGPDCRLDPTEDFTRLSLDTIALCSMSYRLNSFYREDKHPFVRAMSDFLTECGRRSKRPALLNWFMVGSWNKWQSDIKYMTDLATNILENRRNFPIDKNDMLNAMLLQVDQKTEERLADETIVKNLLVFLIAGHETTAGLLSFCVYLLIRHPDVMRKAQAEVDDVLGEESIQPDDLSGFPYLTAIIRETLRLHPPIPYRQVHAREDTTIISRCSSSLDKTSTYLIPHGRRVIVHIEQVHRDKDFWGDDADDFKPERMMNGKFEALPTGAWQPFGYGTRVCIGRPFVVQESLLALALILQKFDCVFDIPEGGNFDLELMQTLTLKPANLFIRAIPRKKEKM